MSKLISVEALNNKIKIQGYVYFVGHGDIVKIGQTLNIGNRMSQLLVSNPFLTLNRLLFANGYELLEKKFHSYFSKNKVVGEWYRINDQEIDVALKELVLGEIKIIKEEKYNTAAQSHTSDEKIIVLEGENKNLKKENKLLREIIDELQKAIKFRR